MARKTRRVSRKTMKKTRKLGKKAGAWNALVMKHYRAGKNKSKDYSLADAMKAAKRERDAK